jgi:phage shock protein PspC (stress-responsive transcriptional regulator)
MDTDNKQDDIEGPRLLRRSVDGRMVAGVAMGLAQYFDVDVMLVRIVLVALAFLGGAAVPLYLAAWLLIPEEGSELAVPSEVLDHLRYH